MGSERNPNPEVTTRAAGLTLSGCLAVSLISNISYLSRFSFTLKNKKQKLREWTKYVAAPALTMVISKYIVNWSHPTPGLKQHSAKRVAAGFEWRRKHNFNDPRTSMNARSFVTFMQDKISSTIICRIPFRYVFRQCCKRKNLPSYKRACCMYMVLFSCRTRVFFLWHFSRMQKSVPDHPSVHFLSILGN